ncbi:aminodeoxychorismate lyase [Herbiconiux daphne]|uniref:Aminodeoxychorismate lyase n=1 Tax=Herbiconiux daphne TaxID=2970914 RepID=A0ABT2H2F4_9MICO|nr:aminodeoxychorismate lyase [Herbiconiux daphne]MCS5734129.1 aminodeoxychorismate lyase [Herbiconiux daphne]
MSVPTLILVTRPVTGVAGERTDAAGTPAQVPHSDLGFVVARASEPQLSVLDLGVTRGDGIFETVMVSSGQAPAIDAHLARFAESARLLDLPEPDEIVWTSAIAAAVALHPRVPVLAVKLVLTRGIEGTGRPTGWVVAQAARDFTAQRENGIRVVTLDRGYRHDVAQTSPWLLQGAKTLSYALNAAALREAARRDADDVIFISSDGFVLEAPTASVLLREGNRFCTPPAELGILPGTTQRRAFEFLRVYGFETDAVRLRASELKRADAIWLLSSIRQAVAVIELDGADVGFDRTLTAQLNEHLAAAGPA